MTKKLALLGGTPVIQERARPFPTIGPEEIDAVVRVMKRGELSKFLGTWSPEFYGGQEILSFEEDCKSFFGVKHAITVNSWTSGLMAAIGALEIQPGDEVIVSPWTMSATATAIINWNAIPVFCDIDDTFCLDPDSVVRNITDHTRAIVAVDIFGQSCDMNSLMQIAKRHNLKVLTDSAQSPGALYGDKYAGTISDIGGFSLNYHKHVHTGEGGIIVTEDDALAERVCLIRNHAEAVVESKGVKNLSNMIGYNFRMGEIEGAIGKEQLKKLKQRIEYRQQAASVLTDRISSLEGLTVPVVRQDCTHVYYSYPILLDIDHLGLPRARIYDALVAEGLCGLSEGYQNLHLLPMYQHKKAYGSESFPWSIAKREVSYRKGICPSAEYFHDTSLLTFGLFDFGCSTEDVDRISSAFEKVWHQLDSLR